MPEGCRTDGDVCRREMPGFHDHKNGQIVVHDKVRDRYLLVSQAGERTLRVTKQMTE